MKIDELLIEGNGFKKFKKLAKTYQLAILNSGDYEEGNEDVKDIEDQIRAMPNGAKLLKIAQKANTEFEKASGRYHSVGAGVPKKELKKSNDVLDTAASLFERLSDVQAKKHPPEGLFKDGSAEKIAAWALRAHGGDEGKAMASLNFYNNRAGKNEGGDVKSKVAAAKKIIQAKKKD